MERKTASLGSLIAGAALALVIAQIAVTSVNRYFTGAEPPPALAANAFADPFLLIHVAAGILALVVGPFQFIGRIRARRPALHRATGLVYVGATAVSAPSGFMLALGTSAGPVAGTGFALLALLLAMFTALGLRAALERRFDDHRAWMIRSFAMTAAAITLRLMLPASAALGVDFLTAYQAIAWLCWTTNLALAEYWIRRTRASAAGYPALAAA